MLKLLASAAFRALTTLFFVSLAPNISSVADARAQQHGSFDYWQQNREIIQRGVQAMLLCNGLFTSDRTLDQVYSQELRYLRQPIGTPAGGEYVVDWQRKAVAVGDEGRGPGGPAAPRPGVGRCGMAARPDAALSRPIRLFKISSPFQPVIRRRFPATRP